MISSVVESCGQKRLSEKKLFGGPKRPKILNKLSEPRKMFLRPCYKTDIIKFAISIFQGVKSCSSGGKMSATLLNIIQLEKTGAKISTFKTEICFSRNIVYQCSTQVGGVSLKRLEKFKYLGIAFTSDRRQDEELDVLFCKAFTVMRALQHSVVLKW